MNLLLLSKITSYYSGIPLRIERFSDLIRTHFPDVLGDGRFIKLENIGNP
jgi:hypothetical protein